MVGEKHKIAIECKNYSKKVSIAKIRDFFGVIYDIGDIKGIFITKVGYQSGAIKFGEYYNISLKEMRFPVEDDWEGRIKDIIIKGTAYAKNVTKIDVKFDNKWVAENTDYKNNDEIKIEGCNKEIMIENKLENNIFSLYELESKLPIEFKEAQNLQMKYEFADAYIFKNNCEKIKIAEINFTYNVSKSDSQIKIEGEKIAKAILKDVKTNNIKFFKK